MVVEISHLSAVERYRKELSPLLSQERMAWQSGITLQSYRNAASGKEIYLSTAIAIWKALNQERKNRDLPLISFEQLWVAPE